MKQGTDSTDGLFTYEIKVNEKLCHVVASGNITFQSTLEALHTLANAPGFKKDFNVLADLRQINYHPTYNEVLGLQQHLVSMKDNFQNKIAMVTTNFFWVIGELVSNLSRPCGINILAFNDIEKARQWISQLPGTIYNSTTGTVREQKKRQG